MTKFLITLHVLAVVLLIGPIGVAVSLFPRFAKEPGSAVAALLHRVSKLYGIGSILVPILGFAAAGALKVTDNQWVIESTVITLVAALLLGLVIVPAQRKALADAATADRLSARLASTGGIFNLLWLVVVVLMVYRPGFHINK